MTQDEFAAAVIAGVMALPDAARLVARALGVGQHVGINGRQQHRVRQS